MTTQLIHIIQINSKDIQPPYTINETYLSKHGENIGMVMSKVKISNKQGSIYRIKELIEDPIFIQDDKGGVDSYPDENKSITSVTTNKSLLNMFLDSNPSGFKDKIKREMDQLKDDDLELISDLISRLLRK